jgi:hypothetical protein
MSSSSVSTSGNSVVAQVGSSAETAVLTTDALEPGNYARIMLSLPNPYNGTLTVRRGTDLTGEVVYSLTRQAVFLPSTVLVLDDDPASQYTVTVTLSGYNYTYNFPLTVVVTAFVDQF